MEIQFNCPGCKQSLLVDETLAGTRVLCPACAQTLLVPHPAAAPRPALGTAAGHPHAVHAASAGPPADGNALALWALVLGIIGLVPVLGLATGLVALLLGILALSKRTRRKGLATAGTILGGLAVLMIPVHLAVLSPMLATMKFGAGTAVCASNVQTIGTAIGEYRRKHGGSDPRNLEELVEEGLLAPKVLFCPLDKGKAGRTSYDYTRSKGQGSGGLIVWDRVPHTVAGQVGGRTVLDANLTVTFLLEKDFRTAPKAHGPDTRKEARATPPVVTRIKPVSPPPVPRTESPPKPVEKVMTLTGVLDELKSAHPNDTRPLLKFLLDSPVADEHRRAVIGATKPWLNDMDAGNMAFEVFLRWADKEQIPDFIDWVRIAPKSPRGKESMKFLSRTGDARAAEPLAACLSDFFTAGDAKAALAALGDVAKPTVLAYYQHENRGAREAARELLRGYNATEEETFAETLKALQNGSTASRQSAIDDLTSAQLSPQQQVAACRALRPLVTDGERAVYDGARKAMTAMATRADADFLLGLMTSVDDGVRQFAGDLLVKLKDARVAKPLAVQLADPNKTHQAGRALAALGSLAEPAVLPYLRDKELNTRKRAAEVLGEIGTSASLSALGNIARDKKHENFFAKVAAERAIAAIKARAANERP